MLNKSVSETCGSLAEYFLIKALGGTIIWFLYWILPIALA